MTMESRQRTIQKPALRPMTLADVQTILDMERAAFPDIPDERLWKREQVAGHIERFPEGQWVVERSGVVLGSCMNLRTTWERATSHHSWHDITGGGRLTTHVPDGDVLYGTEIMVHPQARRMGIGRQLFNRRFGYVVERGLRAFVTGGRLPGYRAMIDRYKPWDYVEAVVRGDVTDAVLTPELRWGLTPLDVMCGYMMDPPSAHHATLVAWVNPGWEAQRSEAADG